ncbi:hypothetical protein V6Z11_A07G045900 [Gossypium hirsutum]
MTATPLPWTMAERSRCCQSVEEAGGNVAAEKVPTPRGERRTKG